MRRSSPKYGSWNAFHYYLFLRKYDHYLMVGLSRTLETFFSRVFSLATWIETDLSKLNGFESVKSWLCLKQCPIWWDHSSMNEMWGQANYFLPVGAHCSPSTSLLESLGLLAIDRLHSYLEKYQMYSGMLNYVVVFSQRECNWSPSPGCVPDSTLQYIGCMFNVWRDLCPALVKCFTGRSWICKRI